MEIHTVSPNLSEVLLMSEYTYLKCDCVCVQVRNTVEAARLNGFSCTHIVICTHFNTQMLSLYTCMQTTHTSHDTHTICIWEYHENLLTKIVSQIDSHGQREHLELISLPCFDKSFSADFRLTIQTLLIHRNHICLLPIPIVNNQQVRWGCVFSPYFNSLFC